MSERLEPDLISEVDYGEDAGEPDAEDAPDAAEESQLDEAAHFDELGCIGFALAKSVSLAEEIRSHFQNLEGFLDLPDTKIGDITASSDWMSTA